VTAEPVPSGLIFVEAEDSLLMYASAQAACDCPHLAELEAAPVAYGARGEVYRVGRQDSQLTFEAADEPPRPEALKSLLLRYFDACEDPADADEPLDELVGRAWGIECNYRLRCGSDEEIKSRRMPVWGYLALVAVPAAILYLTLRR
jgi:hypothetical protein